MNLAKLSKVELVWMSRHFCAHGHTYLAHPQCYKKEALKTEKIAFLDIECSNLDANFGIILSYILKEWKGKTSGRCITPHELKSPDQDKRLVSECISGLENFDRIIGFYSARFDIPFVRTRSMAHNLHFPGFGTIRHTDLWFHVRSKMKLNSNRLQVVCDFLDIPAKAHKLDGLIWTKALSGDKKALDFIYTHNVEDGISTELLFERLLPFMRLTNTTM